MVVTSHIQAQVAQALSCSATGSLANVKEQLNALIERYELDEIILSTMIHDHSARVRSFEISAQALSDLCDHKAAAEQGSAIGLKQLSLFRWYHRSSVNM